MAPKELVPQTESIAEVYATDDASVSVASPEHQLRWNGLIASFKKLYGILPEFVARSPGRVNIIGEHIDYSFYDVLPTAVSVDVLIAARVVPSNGPDASVKIANINPEKFPTREFAVPSAGDVEIDQNKHEWINYFKAGLVGALQSLRSRDGGSFLAPASLELLVDGNVPPGGGISSSAAFVCSSALAVMKANKHDVSKEDLFNLSVVSERAVGVYSGGMDQAASIFSKRGFLQYTQFFPQFRAQQVPVPPSTPEITFLIAQSFITSDKKLTAPKQYNLRVAECTLATVVLAKLHDIVLKKDSSSLGYCLRSFHDEFMRKHGRLQDPLEYQLDSLILDTTEKLTKEEGYTRQEIAQILAITVETLETDFLSTFPVQAERFLLRQRALHCFKEARRVLDFKARLTHSSNKLDEHDVKYLGQLLNESQASCARDYDCSCPEVNDICKIARKAGTLGSRVTGAGWGGCTVHMVPLDKVEAVTTALKDEYYLKRFPDITEEKLKEAFVVSKPSNGSFLISGSAITSADI